MFNQGLRADSVAPEFTSLSLVVAFTQTRRPGRKPGDCRFESISIQLCWCVQRFFM